MTASNQSIFNISVDKTHVALERDLPILDFIRCKTILTNHQDKIVSIVIWKNRFVLTASIDDQVHMYDIFTSRKICQFPSFGDPVYSMEIIETRKNSFLCFSDLCQRLFLMDLKKRALITHYNHNRDVIFMMDLKNERNVLFSDIDGNLFLWDLKRNESKQLIIAEKKSDFMVSGMKFLDEKHKIVCVSCYSSTQGQLLIVKPKYEGVSLKNFDLLSHFELNEKVSSLNYSKTLNSVYLGSNGSINIIDLSDNSIKNHKLFCSQQSTINEIVLIEGRNTSCWGIMVNNFDGKLFIVDFKNEINYEVPDSLITVYYFSMKSKLELFQWKEHLFLGLVSQEAEIVVIYEVLFRKGDNEK